MLKQKANQITQVLQNSALTQSTAQYATQHYNASVWGLHIWFANCATSLHDILVVLQFIMIGAAVPAKMMIWAHDTILLTY
jgi:hypothetical protein